MGKISEALKKVMEEREKQKQLQREAIMRASVERKEEKSPKESSPQKAKKIPLEERFKIKEQLYIVKPKDNSEIDARVVVYSDYSSPISEQYRILRTNIKSSLTKARASKKISTTKPATSPYIFTITSALHGEGKTVTAVNLAVALASDLESRVLLIDCDLRNGEIHKLLNLNYKPGLSEILTGDFDWSVALHRTLIRNLFIIPRGQPPSNPSELLGSKKMRLILERLKVEEFTYIILDTPPLLTFTDATILGVQTEGVVMVVEAQRTRAHIVKKAKEFLEQTHSRFLGFILTKVDHYTPDFYGYYYHYHYKSAGVGS
ncbi:MAG: capsular biosynthesis protein [Candidatus Omnitrophota bacterium]|nr:MAG: capsular biosynthesis protein [Candidatus Omnitrophota bacterium]